MSTSAIVLIAAGLFLLGGVYSFWKQKQSKGVIAVLAIGAVLCLVSGLMRL
ncbi:hypothetical protein [Peterkaempfera bronchialis]|uniref:hypothetical protein n=1 Tax=Peterkaempfera bronchialis TaxID=2126346 RepID=UPI001588C704|nr:hypothetical protein [Peterkaempfera bronchialis]